MTPTARTRWRPAGRTMNHARPTGVGGLQERVVSTQSVAGVIADDDGLEDAIAGGVALGATDHAVPQLMCFE